MTQVFEFLVWNNCSNNCKFCYQKMHYNPCTHEDKIKSINKVIEFLNSDKFIKGSHILLVGGELFDDISISSEFIKLIELINNMMLSDDIDLLYINTNLIYEDISLLISTLNALDKSIHNRLRFTTSYDLCGRFKDKRTQDLMLSNLKFVTSNYQINTIANMILTDYFCDKVLSKEFSIRQFSEQYNCKYNIIPHIVFNSSLRAEKSKIFKTLLYIEDEIPGFIKFHKHEMNLTYPRYLWEFDRVKGELIYKSSKISDCGHSVNYKLYSDSGNCYVCDLNSLFS